MARVRLNLPKNFMFHTDIQVRIGDINYGNHLGNDAVLSLVNEARVRFLQNYGWSELNIAGFGLVVTDAVVVYKSQGYYGDVLRVAVALDDFSTYGCDFYYRIDNKQTGREIARAKTGIAFYDYTAGKMVQMPEAFKGLLADKI